MRAGPHGQCAVCGGRHGRGGLDRTAGPYQRLQRGQLGYPVVAQVERGERVELRGRERLQAAGDLVIGQK